MTTRKLLTALAAAIARNDAAATAVLIAELETRVEPDLLADILEALLRATPDEPLPPMVSCA